MCGRLSAYKDKFESVAIAEPLLGEVGGDATVINDDTGGRCDHHPPGGCKDSWV